MEGGRGRERGAFVLLCRSHMVHVNWKTNKSIYLSPIISVLAGSSLVLWYDMLKSEIIARNFL